MTDSNFPVPPIRPLPGDPTHPSGLRLPVSAVVSQPTGADANADIALHLRCPRKTDAQTLEEVYVTRRFLLSKEGARSLVHEILQALDQE